VSKFQHHTKLCAECSTVLVSSLILSPICSWKESSCWMLLLLWQSWKFHVYISHHFSKLVVITDMLILICDLDFHIYSVLNPYYIIMIIIITILLLLLFLFFTTIFSKVKQHVWLKCNPNISENDGTRRTCCPIIFRHRKQLQFFQHILHGLATLSNLHWFEKFAAHTLVSS